jgi:hypothetical protein
MSNSWRTDGAAPGNHDRVSQAGTAASGKPIRLAELLQSAVAVGLASASGFDNPNLPVASVCFTAPQKAELRRVAGATLLASQRKIPAYGRARVSINRLLFGSYRDDPDWRW